MSLHGAKVFSSLDLKSGYWQVKIEPASQQKRAFVTPSGLFKYMSFRLKNAAATFQRLMEVVLADLKGVIDDIIVYYKSETQHLQDLADVFLWLEKANLSLNLKRCNLMQHRLQFLGHIVSADGIVTDNQKVEAVHAFSTPRFVNEFQRFLWMAGWFSQMNSKV